MTIGALPGLARPVPLRQSIDGVSLLTVYLVLLIGIPSQFVVAPLGGAGTPALLIGVGCLLWWIFMRTYALEPAAREWQPIRSAAGLFAIAVGLSYIAGCFRPISAAELSTATLGLITLAGWLGVLLLAHDGVVDASRMDRYLGRLTLAGTLLATFGLFQFVTHEAWTELLSIPGLTPNHTQYETTFREGFTRPLGTAVHPIEFGSVLAMLLPVSIARAAGHSDRAMLLRVLPPGAIVVAIALSSSRSALVCAVVGAIVLLPALERRVRRVAAAGMGLLGMAIFVLVPGMLGTLLGMFTGVGDDSSARSRLDSYSVAGDYLSNAGPFGRGFGTFLPRYRIFDNEFLLLSVEIGIVGLVAVLAMLVSAILAGTLRGRRAAVPSQTTSIQGLVGGVAAGGMSLALFDAFSFPMVPGVLFLLVGLVGAMRKLIGPPAR